VHAESDEARDAPTLRRSNEKQYAWVCLARLSRPLSGRGGASIWRRGSERLCEPRFGRDHGVGIDLVDWMGLKWLLSRQIVHASIRI